MRSLTSAAIARIKPPAAGQIDHFDKGYPGLSLRCSYRGAKTFVHVYRFNGKLHRVTLGRWPALSLVDARNAWRRGRETIERGEDPARQIAMAPDTFAAVAAEWLKRDQAGNRSVAEVARIIAREAMPQWGDRLILTLTRRDAIELIDRVADRGKLTAARRLHSHLHRLFRWAVGRGILERNPMAELPKPGAEVRRDRVLSDPEIAAIWKASAELWHVGDDLPHGWPFGPALRVLLLTGARKDEICSLRWSEIASEAINLPAARSKSGEPRLIPLSVPAFEIIDDLPRIGDSDFVFTTTGCSPISGWSKAKAELDEEAVAVLGSAMPPWRIHDFRRTVATGMQRLGISLQVIEAVLGHVGGSRAGIVGVYQRHSFDTEKRAALDAWAAELMRIISKTAYKTLATPMNVHHLPARRARA